MMQLPGIFLASRAEDGTNNTRWTIPTTKSPHQQELNEALPPLLQSSSYGLGLGTACYSQAGMIFSKDGATAVLCGNPRKFTGQGARSGKFSRLLRENHA